MGKLVVACFKMAGGDQIQCLFMVKIGALPPVVRCLGYILLLFETASIEISRRETWGAKIMPICHFPFQAWLVCPKNKVRGSSVCAVVASAANLALSLPNAARQRSKSSTARLEGARPSNTGPPCREKAWWSCWTTWAQKRVRLSTRSYTGGVAFDCWASCRWKRECEREIVRWRGSVASHACTDLTDNEQQFKRWSYQVGRKVCLEPMRLGVITLTCPSLLSIWWSLYYLFIVDVASIQGRARMYECLF